jgi:hypothetical protein
VHEIVTDASALAGTTLSLYNLAPTGKEVVAALERVKGSKPEIVEFTEAQYQAALDKGPGEAIGAALTRKWGTGQVFKGKVVTSVDGYEQKSLDEVLKQYA